MSISPEVMATTKKAKVTSDIVVTGTDEDGSGEESSSDEESSSSEEQNQNQIKLNKRELSSKIQEGRDEGIKKGHRDVLSTVNDTLGTDFESVDQLGEELGNKVENPEVVSELQNKLSKKDEKIEALSGKIQDFRVRGKINKDVNEQLGEKKSLKLGVDDIRSLMDNRGYGYTEKDGKTFVTENGDRVLNDDGNYKTYGEAVVEFAESQGLIEGSAKGGSGGSTSTGSSSSVEENPFKTGNVTKQAELYREDRQKYNRLKKAAGK